MNKVLEALGIDRMIPVGEYMEGFINKHELHDEFMGFWRRHKAARRGKFPQTLAMREFLRRRGLWEKFLVYKDARSRAEALHSL